MQTPYPPKHRPKRNLPYFKVAIFDRPAVSSSANYTFYTMNRLEQLLKIHQETPEDPFLLFAIAKEYECMGQIPEALRWYLDLKRRHPDYVGLYYHLGKLYELLDEADNARQVYQEGIQVAKHAGDINAERELQSALSWLEA